MTSNALEVDWLTLEVYWLKLEVYWLKSEVNWLRWPMLLQIDYLSQYTSKLSQSTSIFYQFWTCLGTMLAPIMVHLTSGWPQLGAKLAPRDPTWSQAGPQDFQHRPKMPLSQHSPRLPTWPQLGPTWLQLGPNLPQLGPNLASSCVNLAPNWATRLILHT